MFNLRDSARKATVSCELMAGREKISQTEIGEKEVKINAIDFITGNNGEKVPVLTCEEYPDRFFFGGAAFSKIADAWLSVTNGDVDVLNQELAANPVAVKMERLTTKTGKTFVKVNVL